jgi:hypothetical protein
VDGRPRGRDFKNALEAERARLEAFLSRDGVEVLE